MTALDPLDGRRERFEKWARKSHPLSRCIHGKALRDAAGSLLEPTCGCRETGREEYIQWCQENGIDEWTCFPFVAWQAAWTARAAREREWIPVAEKRPKSGDYLGHSVRRGVEAVRYFADDNQWTTLDVYGFDSSPETLNDVITHWMPFPDPPEAALSETEPEPQEKP